MDGFGEAVATAFGEDRTEVSGFDELDRWRATVRKVYKNLVMGQKKLGVAHGGQARKLTKAISLFGLAMRSQPDHDKIEALIKLNPYLEGLICMGPETENFRYEVEGLQEYISRMYGEGVKEAVAINAEDLDKMERPAPYLPGGGGGGDYLRDLKSRLPGDRSRLSALRPTAGSAATSAPGQMDKTIKKYYGVVWSEDENGATGQDIAMYLRGYSKKIPRDLRPAIPNLEEVTDEVESTNDSCAGPDGIPFAVHRADCRAGGAVTSILHRIVATLGRGEKGPKSFNQARLFLIAKTDSLLVEDTRPISGRTRPIESWQAAWPRRSPLFYRSSWRRAKKASARAELAPNTSTDSLLSSTGL